MPSSITHSGFLTKVACVTPAFIRPPWALPEPVFLSLCIGCSDCRDECPRGLLQKSVDGFPVVDFTKGDCHFCGECVDACAHGALTRSFRGVRQEPWQLKAYVAGSCLGEQGVLCRQCAGHCTAQAIRFDSGIGQRIPDIDAQRCNGCGACLRHCPTVAISLYKAPSL